MGQFAGLDLLTGEAIPTDWGKFLIHGSQGSGKRLPLGTKVLTPTGWMRIEDLTLGQMVIGVDGAPWPVYGISQIELRETYRVTLNDGGSVAADADHLWEVTNAKEHTMVLTTEQVRQTLERGGTCKVPRMAAAQLVSGDFTIPPYVLGVLLAIGHLRGRTVHWITGEQPLLDGIKPMLTPFNPAVRYDDEGNMSRISFRGTAMRDALEELNLRVADTLKFIPENYFTASIKQRRDLLAGLFDGAGRLSNVGQRLYHAASERLAHDVQRLCWSLGIGASMRGKANRTWCVAITTPHTVFRYSRWAELDKSTWWDESRRIVSVERIGETAGLCIAVDAPRNLYVTEDYIVTHNTTLASTIAECGKTLFIDLPGEKGVRSFRGAPYEKNIDVIRPKSITALDDIFWELNRGNHNYVAVVIDSLTSVQKTAMRFLLGHDETAVREIKQGTAPADIRTWGQALDIMVDTATFWYGLADGQRGHPMHVVMTCQTRISENEETGAIQRVPDVQKGALSIVLASPDYVVYTDVEQNLDALSDESLPAVNYIVRFGANPDYRTKGRLPYNLRGKVPPVLGRGKTPPSLVTLGRLLGVGGMPAKKATSKTNNTNNNSNKED